MSFDPSAVLPWEAVAVLGGNGEPEPVAAGTLVRTPDGAFGSPWYVGERYIGDAGLAERQRRLNAERAERDAVRRASAEARERTSAQVHASSAALVGRKRAAPVPAADLPAGVELRRLAAAAVLTCTSLGAGRYRVTGGAEPHHVDLGAEGTALPVCDCADATYRGTYCCKHELAARAAAGEAPIAVAVAVLQGLVSRGGVYAALPMRGAGKGADAHTRTTGPLTSGRAA